MAQNKGPVTTFSPTQMSEFRCKQAISAVIQYAMIKGKRPAPPVDEDSMDDTDDEPTVLSISSPLKAESCIRTTDMPWRATSMAHDSMLEHTKRVCANPKLAQGRYKEGLGWMVPMNLLNVIDFMASSGMRLRYIIGCETDFDSSVLGPLTVDVDRQQEKIPAASPTVLGQSLYFSQVLAPSISNVFDHYRGNWERWYNDYREKQGFLTALPERLKLSIFEELYHVTHGYCIVCCLYMNKFVCGCCKFRGYCSKECQKADRSRHRPFCKPPQ